MICDTPIRHGIYKGKPARGLNAGYLRHYKAGEPACVDCLAGHADRVQGDRNSKAHADYIREWTNKNRERVNAQRRERYQKNPHSARGRTRRRKALVRQVTVVPFTEEQLDQRMAMWGYRCWMCGRPYEVVDHVKPLSKGGLHTLSNLRPACWSCNASKGAKWPLEEVA